MSFIPRLRELLEHRHEFDVCVPLHTYKFEWTLFDFFAVVVGDKHVIVVTHGTAQGEIPQLYRVRKAVFQNPEYKVEVLVCHPKRCARNPENKDIAHLIIEPNWDGVTYHGIEGDGEMITIFSYGREIPIFSDWVKNYD